MRFSVLLIKGLGGVKIYRVSSITKFSGFFSGGVAMFELVFLSLFFSKLLSFCAHWKGNFLNFPKHPQLLSVVQFWYPLQPINEDPPFFWDTLYI